MRPPRTETHAGFTIVRDDETPGGTKMRALPQLLETAAAEVIYASPAYGYAQIALAHAAATTGRRATVFVAQRRTRHPRTAEAHAAGAHIIEVPHGYLTNVQAKARQYANDTGATLLPFGFDDPTFATILADAIRTANPLHDEPAEVWSVAGSGTLQRALQAVWPDATFHAVAVGRTPDAGRATIHTAPEKFERDAKHPPPFPSCSNYDAKAWQFMLRHAQPGALFWNVAA